MSHFCYFEFFLIFLTFDQFFNMSIYFINAGCSSYGSNDSLENYDPSLHRKLDHPTSNIDTMIHLLKGNIGTGNFSVFLISSYFSAFSRCFHSIFVFFFLKESSLCPMPSKMLDYTSVCLAQCSWESFVPIACIC